MFVLSFNSASESVGGAEEVKTGSELQPKMSETTTGTLKPATGFQKQTQSVYTILS
jgi:hypothetical protein